MIKVTYQQFKEFVTTRDLDFIEFGNEFVYELFASDSVFTIAAILDKNPSDTTDLDDYLANLRPLSNRPIDKKTSLHVPKVAIYEPEGTFKTHASHNLCDPTTWWQKSTVVTGETLVQMPPPDGLTYTFANQNIIDVEHGKVVGEQNYTLDFATMSYSNTLRWTHKVSIFVGGVEQSSGYTIDYALGRVTFDSAPSGAVTADYRYAGSSEYTLEASAGKVLQIRHVEIQFSGNYAWTTPIIQQIRVYNPANPPAKIKIEHISIAGEYELISLGNEGKGTIPAYGNLNHDVYVFPFAYGRTIDLRDSQGGEITIMCENDIAQAGDFASVTMYTTETDE